VTPQKTNFQNTAYHNLRLSRPKQRCGAKGGIRGITQVQMSSVSAYTFSHGADIRYVSLTRIIQHYINRKLQLNETNA